MKPNYDPLYSLRILREEYYERLANQAMGNMLVPEQTPPGPEPVSEEDIEYVRRSVLGEQ